MRVARPWRPCRPGPATTGGLDYSQVTAALGRFKKDVKATIDIPVTGGVGRANELNVQQLATAFNNQVLRLENKLQASDKENGPLTNQLLQPEAEKAELRDINSSLA
ncbi:hypothetical protein P154DRAFT_580740 [Amniculicola lignicola CBS 123094]|uniref:Uncharacterized protein n=1 Tax=Amniculicola lignicola CBS 123094 TaxID=1392246 RepID=A0A6A5WD37_9PLEO|nr:hypothetical protein P154DRAFT_580740 [Amniculicola lignicola CBS 123094]